MPMSVRNAVPLCLRALVIALALLPGGATEARAAIYFTQPYGESNDFPLPPTQLYAVAETGGMVTLIGNIRLGTVDVAVEALALDSHGNLYGFIYEDGTGST